MSSKHKKSTLYFFAAVIICVVAASVYLYRDLEKESLWLTSVNPGVVVTKTEIISARIKDLLPAKVPELSEETKKKLAKETNSIANERSVATKEQAKAANPGAKEIADGVYTDGAKENLETLRSRLKVLEDEHFSPEVIASMRRYVARAEKEAADGSKPEPKK